jgi:hypothetical protein
LSALAWLRRQLGALGAWFGPVASSVHGRINGEEARRIAARFVVAAAGAGSVWAGVAHAARDPEVITAFVGFAAVAIGAVFEGIHRYHEGERPQSDPDKPPFPLPGSPPP